MCVHVKIFYYPSKKKQVCDIFNFLILFIAVLGIILQKKSYYIYLSLCLSLPGFMWVEQIFWYMCVHLKIIIKPGICKAFNLFYN